MRTLPVVTDLPEAMLAEIGRIIVQYSYLEMVLSRVAYNALRD